MHYLSQFLVLEPGDLINTGTPPGSAWDSVRRCGSNPATSWSWASTAWVANVSRYSDPDDAARRLAGGGGQVGGEANEFRLDARHGSHGSAGAEGQWCAGVIGQDRARGTGDGVAGDDVVRVVVREHQPWIWPHTSHVHSTDAAPTHRKRKAERWTDAVS